MINGFYSVTYAAGIPVGCGQVRLHDGILSGSDAAFDWSGQYVVEAGRIEGFMVAMPSTSGALNVFLDDQAVELDFSGVVEDRCIEMRAIRRGTAGPVLVATLSPIDL